MKTNDRVRFLNLSQPVGTVRHVYEPLRSLSDTNILVMWDDEPAPRVHRQSTLESA